MAAITRRGLKPSSKGLGSRHRRARLFLQRLVTDYNGGSAVDTVSLANHFLIAMPAMADPNFARTLTFICEHNA